MELNIEEELTNLGYHFFGDDNNFTHLIEKIINNNNNRYLKAIPFLIYKHDINFKHIYLASKNKPLLNTILSITQDIFYKLGISKKIDYILRNEKEREETLKKIKSTYEDFESEFKLQLNKDKKTELIKDKQDIYTERNTQYALSQLFTKKEKEIIKSILSEKPITKTDYEYYSRKTKKKIKSIINLSEFAKSISELNPKKDEKLFQFKKELEEWLTTSTKYKNINIEKFFTFDNKITIIFQGENKNNKKQYFNTIKELNKIKNKNILKFLNTYKNHEF